MLFLEVQVIHAKNPSREGRGESGMARQLEQMGEGEGGGEESEAREREESEGRGERRARGVGEAAAGASTSGLVPPEAVSGLTLTSDATAGEREPGRLSTSSSSSTT